MADKRDILINLLGKETVSPAAAKAGDAVGKLGDRMDATADDAKRLDREIDQAQKGLEELAVRYARTQDAAERLDLTKSMRKQQAELRKLSKAKDLLPDFDAAGEGAASGFAASFVARVGPLMASAPMGPAGVALGGALAAAAAPTLAAGISGAVVGGAGIGGVIGGVALAARDPRVQSAGASLGAFVLGDLERRASGFVPPVLEGISDIRAGWQEMGPDLDRIFKSSRFVDPLVQGAISGGKKFAAGFADAIEAADPATEAISRGFDTIGEAAGKALSTMADDADEGAAAIDDLTLSVRSFVEASAQVVHAGATLKGWSEQADVAIDKGRYLLQDWMSSGGVLKHFGVQLDLTADGFAAGSKEAEAYRQATLGTATAADFATLKAGGMTDAEIAAADASGTYRQQLDGVNDALGNAGNKAAAATVEFRSFGEVLKGLRDQNLEVLDTEIAFERALDETATAAKNAKGGIDTTTEAGRKNLEQLTGLVRETKAHAAATAERMGSEEAGAAVTEKGRAAFLRAADAMGVEEGKATDLANQLFGIPNVKREVEVKTKQTPIDLSTLAGRIKAIKNKNVVISVHNKIVTTRVGGRNVGIGDGIGGLAGGGPVEGSGPKGVDSELRMLAPGEHVLAADEVDAAGGHSGVERIRSVLRGGGSAGGPAVGASAGHSGGGGCSHPVVLNVDATATGPMQRMFITWLVQAVRDAGGNPKVLGLGGNW